MPAEDPAPDAVARIGELAHKLHHDVRNPINHILGFAELLLEIPGSKLDEKQAHYMTRIRANAEQVLELLKEFIAEADALAGEEPPANPSAGESAPKGP